MGFVQLINGEIVHTLATDPHQLIGGSIYTVLKVRLGRDRVRIAPVNVYLDDDNYIEPDVFYTGGDDASCTLKEGKFWHGAPALIVEVVSPSSIRYDRVEKFDLYEKHGVREYWIVEPVALTIEVYALENGVYRRVGGFGAGGSFTSPLLDATFNVDELFGA
jgi:Uma2 family endonuclease